MFVDHSFILQLFQGFQHFSLNLLSWILLQRGVGGWLEQRYAFPVVFFPIHHDCSIAFVCFEDDDGLFHLL